MENAKQGAFACASDGCHQPGLTKREYFAAIAMQGLCACPDLAVSRVELAEESVKQADALLKALETKS
jgi:hypothetical protein